MIAVGTTGRVKATAKKLRRALIERDIDATHCFCLEALAVGLGFNSYAALNASDCWDADRFDPDRCAARLAQLHGISNNVIPLTALAQVLSKETSHA